VTHDEQPAALSDVLNTLAGRLRRVDLRVINDARRLWPTIVEPVIAEHCRVEMVKDGVLIVSVPSGAFAQQIARDDNFEWFFVTRNKCTNVT
jgi:predicted nucleic acid-binding Zn ribbon protein